LTFERDIAAPADQVWAILTDVERYARRFVKVDSAELRTEGPLRVGTRWQETRKVFGRSITVENRVNECEPGRRYVTEAHVGAWATTEFVLTPSADRSHTSVRVTFQTRGGSLGYRLAAYLNRRRIRECVIENNTQDLVDLARACEPQIAPDR